MTTEPDLDATLRGRRADTSDLVFTQSEDVGHRLRHLRLSRRLTLRAVAELVGLSESYISQIERGKNTPSLNTLFRISRAYGITPGDLLTDGWNQLPVAITLSERPILELGEMTKFRLIPHSANSLEVLGAVFAEGGSAGDLYVHGDSEELLIVVRGLVEALVGEESFVLGPGETLFYRSSMPHSLRNISQGESEVIWVVSPPS